ncbi:hypothetical protein FF2_021990 [Malus domestica]
MLCRSTGREVGDSYGGRRKDKAVWGAREGSCPLGSSQRRRKRTERRVLPLGSLRKGSQWRGGQEVSMKMQFRVHAVQSPSSRSFLSV